jgi:hypothetical protein
VLSAWLVRQGYSADLQRRYRSSGWLESIGSGAMIRKDDKVGYAGAIHALQTQGGMTLHPGGRGAFALLGKAHYLEMSQKKIVLFGAHRETLPVWFRKYKWGVTFDYYQSDFLPPDLGLVEVDIGGLPIKVSGAPRAMMECLFLAPKDQELFECYELMEGLNNLRPDLIQTLLEECKSVKVKRLFLYMAEKAGHTWFSYLNMERVDLGSGKRSLATQGVYIPKYQITVPVELEKHGRATL